MCFSLENMRSRRVPDPSLAKRVASVTCSVISRFSTRHSTGQLWSSLADSNAGVLKSPRRRKLVCCLRVHGLIRSHSSDVSSAVSVGGLYTSPTRTQMREVGLNSQTRKSAGPSVWGICRVGMEETIYNAHPPPIFFLFGRV